MGAGLWSVAVALAIAGLVGCSSRSDVSGVDASDTAGAGGAAGSTIADADGGALDVADATGDDVAGDVASAGDATDAGNAGDAIMCPASEPGDAGSPEAGTDADGFTGPFDCTLVAGILPTGEWFNAGFESDCLDGAKWEAKFTQYGYINIWGDAGGFAWNSHVVSACATNADAPDRVIFTAWSFDLAYMEDVFTATTVEAVKQFIAHYPSMKRMDLMTLVRCPGDAVSLPSGKMCNPNARVPSIQNITNYNAGQQDCYVPPSVDKALDNVAAQFPGLVFVAPKFYSPACRSPVDGPHLGANNTQVAKDIAAYYRTNP